MLKIVINCSENNHVKSISTFFFSLPHLTAPRLRKPKERALNFVFKYASNLHTFYLSNVNKIVFVKECITKKGRKVKMRQMTWSTCYLSKSNNHLNVSFKIKHYDCQILSNLHTNLNQCYHSSVFGNVSFERLILLYMCMPLLWLHNPLRLLTALYYFPLNLKHLNVKCLDK